MLTKHAAKKVVLERWEHGGRKFVGVSVNGHRLGGYEITEAGCIPFGKRKPRKTEIDAQRAILQTSIARALSAASTLTKIMVDL